MKKYDFDEIHDRRKTSSTKWDIGENELPMWIADMDFMTAPKILEAISKRSKQGIFGYTDPDKGWAKSYVDFYKRRHHLILNEDWLLFSTGVVPTISSSVRKLTKVHDNVVVLSPVYNIFYNSIINNDRRVLQVPLLYENGQYEIDFPSLEEAFRKEETTMMIFCNPANPISKIWSREEMEKIGQLAKKYHVVVLSDEIHCEIIRPGKDYIPYISVSKDNEDNAIMAISVTKAFNLAGIQTSCIVVPNEELRKKVNRQINTDEVAEGNVFAYISAMAALNDSEDYLDELRAYLFYNRDYARKYIQERIPLLSLVDGDATYLLWISLEKLNTDSDTFVAFLRRETGLILSSGRVYGGNGSLFVRMNVACPRKTLLDGLTRLEKGVMLFLKK